MASSTDRPIRPSLRRGTGSHARRRLASAALFAFAILGPSFGFAAPAAIAATAKPTARPAAGPVSPAALLRRATPAALAGDREAVRRAAKAIVALGPVSIPSAAALRPRLRAEAGMGSSACATAYGILLQYGIGGPASPKEAAIWYDRAAADGNRSGARHAALAYALGWGVNRNTGKARKLLAALDPDARAKQMVEISEVMLRPAQFEPELAEEWLERALSLETRSTSKAVLLYEQIRSGDDSRAATIREWLRGRAEKGDMNAATRLADRLLASKEEANHEEAARWLLTAADKGNARAGERLAMLLAASDTGGAPPAVRAYVEAQAKAGSGAAQTSLATAFAYAPSDATAHGRKAEAYLTEVARNGDSEAQYKLGMLFLNDEGDSRSEALARAYLSLSAAKGNALAKTAVAHLGIMPAAKAQALIEREPAPPPT